MAARQNTRQEWAIAIFGGLAMAAALVWLLRGPGLATDAPISATNAQAAATYAPAPAISAPISASVPAVSAPADLALAGLRTGPDGGMAIVVTGGRQYLLRPGRSLPGGLRLLRVEPGRAILGGPAGEQVLAFPDAPRGVVGPALPPGGDPAPWLLATTPQRSAQGVDGWRLTSLAGLPLLARAGLRPGDVLLAANGADLITQEKIMELPQELAANGQLVLRIRRGGQVTEITVKP